ncbi:integrating conjugative element protein [Delftia acidovorans]|jgi:integrating conjugative element protein (TIGR03765 family)|uniref:PFL_4695 family integrating conjugative element protein n=1 Tax=Delftia acidovorans TaxID=80866 RepID=UPI000BC34055|nr:integrating conjugative element protein [Delftia acidovorans]ATH15467.1 integrating conjugative element protein [Delftia acidovorans]
MNLRLLCTLALCSVAAAPAVAGQPLPETQKLQVLHDSGRSVPFAPYVAQLVGDADDPGVLDGLRFPFGARLLRTGVLAQEGLKVFDGVWMTQPMFVLAADELSMRWLSFNKDKLVQLQAVGIVVQAGSPLAFKSLQRLAMPLRLAPETGSWLSEQLVATGANAYPVLVHSNGRAYQILGQEMFQQTAESPQ